MRMQAAVTDTDSQNACIPLATVCVCLRLRESTLWRFHDLLNASMIPQVASRIHHPRQRLRPVRGVTLCLDCLIFANGCLAWSWWDSSSSSLTRSDDFSGFWLIQLSDVILGVYSVSYTVYFNSLATHCILWALCLVLFYLKLLSLT